MNKTAKIITELTNIKTNFAKTINIIDGLTFSTKEQIKKIEFYTNSTYLNGQTDELGREKPFMQILNGMCDTENAAKDLDTKDINLTSDDGNHYVQSFLQTKDLYQWMKDADFAKTLNDMRDVHTRYGSLLVKKCTETEDGEKQLRIELPEWKNMMFDQVNITDNAIVETHFMNVKDIIKKTNWKNKKDVVDKLSRGGLTKRLPVYEIRGDFPLSFFKEINGEKWTDKDEETFTYQLYYIAGTPVESGEKDSDILVPLYWENDTEKVYKFLARKKRAGRAWGVGVMEEGEEAQVWTNDAILKQSRAMEYTSKVISQSASKKLKGRNILTEVDDGTILEHEDNKPITAVNLLPAGGLQQYQALIEQWYNQLERVTSSYSAQRGETPPSGTPFRLQATVLQQSSSVFQNLQEEMGIFIGEIIQDWVLPFNAKKFNVEHILAMDFSAEELQEIDKNFSLNVANEKAKELILSGKLLTDEDYQGFIKQADDFIKQTKSRRFIDIPKDYYKKINTYVTINITGEQKNKAAMLESLNSIIVTYINARAQGIELSNDPFLSQIFMKLIEVSGAGISPIALTGAISTNAQQQPQQPQPQEQAQPQALSLEANPVNG